MTDLVVDARALLRGLREYGIEYVLFGALALLFYAAVRTTRDLDIAVAPDRSNLGRVADWLISIDAVLMLNPQRAFGPRERWGLQKAQTRPS